MKWSLRKHLNHSVFCALLLPGMAMGADTWCGTRIPLAIGRDAANRGAGAPTASLRAIINRG